MKDARTHILNVSKELFLQHSYKEVTMQEIIGKTGLSKGAFYHYFSSKEQVFQEVVDHLLSSLMDVHFTKVSRHSLSAFYHDYIAYFIDSLNMNGETGSTNYFSLIFDALKLFPDVRQKVMQLDQMTQSHWEKVIRQSKEAGEIKSPMADDQIARIFMYTADGIGLNHIFRLAGNEETGTQLLDLWDALYRQLQF